MDLLLSDHSGIKLEINIKRHYRTYSNTWSEKSWIIEEIREKKIKKFLI
jgi:hypothetical protein